ncbi:MAG: AMP-binding protein [Elusimicrobia bacterium]|nr:AMP-binding protein [Elusimicrobiota bacterium]
MKAFLWGRFVEGRGLDAERLARDANSRRAAAAARTTWRTIELLERVGRSWSDPRSTFRRRAQAVMPRVTGFSSEMVRRTLEIIPDLLEAAALRQRLASELGRESALDAWSLEPGGGRAIKAFPLGSVLHVAAGNVFLGCIDSVLMSLLTQNVTLLRLSSADPEFPFLFAESVARADPGRELTGGLAMLSWDKGDPAEAVFKSRLDGVVVWGGPAALAAYRDGLGAGTKLVAFGPKLSFAVVSRAGLREAGVREAARRLARDVCWWDQAACASPQTVFVEGEPGPFLTALERELARAGRRLPRGTSRPDEAASLLEERHRALAAELHGRGRLRTGSGWTVAWRREPALRASPLGRFVQATPYRDAAQLARLIAPSSGLLQTAGLLVAAAERPVYAEALGAAGVTRLPEIGRMLEAEGGEPHDGRYPLQELVRWVSGPPESVVANEEKAYASVVGRARGEAPFYRVRRGGLLSKDDLYEHGPPRSTSLLTRAAEGDGRLVFASGGSTGKPKFCVYSQEEFEQTCRWLAWGLVRSGLEPDDVVANLFVAGNLWSSFMAIEGAARHLRVTHLPVSGTSDADFALDALERFGANAAIGLPSTLVELARRAEAAKRRVRLEKLFYAGEHASEEMAALWRRAFGTRLVRSAGYASVDAGLIGFQCAHCRGSVHHVASGLQKVELVGGEIVATNLIRRWMPVVRYRTGDRGRWVGGACPCGWPSPRFALLGRCDDRINLGGAHIDAGDVGRAIARVPGLSPLYQVIVPKNGGVLRVRVERLGSAAPASDLAERLGRALRDASLELRDSIARGWLEAPAVEVLAPGALPRQPRTGKIRRVVDLR